MPTNKQLGHPLTGLRVLVVEDETLVALLLEDQLAELGHTVIGPITRLQKALEIAQDADIDFAILDVNLDGEESYPIADLLAARHVPFVFSTGYGRRDLPAPHQDRPTLRKPFQRTDLEKLVAELFH